MSDEREEVDIMEEPYRANEPPRSGRRKIMLGATVVGLVAIIGLLIYALGLRSDRNEARAGLRDAEERNRELTDALELHRAAEMDVKQQLTTCGEALSGEKETVTEQTARASALEVQLSTCEVQQSDASQQLAEFEEFTAKFRKMIDTGKLDVEFRRGQMIVKLPAAILFASGKADLSEAGRAALADVAAIFEKMPQRRFTIAGHTDSARVTNDSFTDNWDLSAARAVAVTRELVRKRVPARNLVAAGYSKYDPIARNSNARGRERNRRIEIILEPALRELALPTADKKKPSRTSRKR